MDYKHKYLKYKKKYLIKQKILSNDLRKNAYKGGRSDEEGANDPPADASAAEGANNPPPAADGERQGAP